MPPLVWKKSRERLARAKDVVFSEMANRGRYHYAEQIIEEMYGDGYAEFFYSGNRTSHEGQIAKGKGTNRGAYSSKVGAEKTSVNEGLAALSAESDGGSSERQAVSLGAEFEGDFLQNHLEENKYAKSVDGKSNDVGAVLSRGWVRGSGSDINGSGGAGRRSDSGNAGVLRQQPQRHTSAAFESVLRNLFQVQETESVKSDLAALGVEKVKGTAGKSKGSAL